MPVVKELKERTIIDGKSAPIKYSTPVFPTVNEMNENIGNEID